MFKNKYLHCVIATGLGTCTGVVCAQSNYPVKPIRMVIALAAGGGVDTSGRMLGQRFTGDGGTVVIGGILSSTVLTLFVLPLLYRWTHRTDDFSPAN